jgi:hypothetical protein
MGQSRLAFSPAVWIPIGAIVGVVSAIIAKHILQRAGDNSLPAVYVVTIFTILLIGACTSGLRTWFLHEGGQAGYRVLGSMKIFNLTVIPLTMMAVVGYSSIHLADLLLGRAEAATYGIVGSVVGGVFALLLWCIARWFVRNSKGDNGDGNPAPIRTDPP